MFTIFGIYPFKGVSSVSAIFGPNYKVHGYKTIIVLSCLKDMWKS